MDIPNLPNFCLIAQYSQKHPPSLHLSSSPPPPSFSSLSSSIFLSLTPFLSPFSSLFILPTLFLPTFLSSSSYLFLPPLPARIRRNWKQNVAKVNVDSSTQSARAFV